MDEFNAWMRHTVSASVRHCHDDGIYAGAEGALRFAREQGPAVADFGEQGRKEIISTYSGICCRAYDLRPPVDAKDWNDAMRYGYDRAMAVRREQEERRATRAKELGSEWT